MLLTYLFVCFFVVFFFLLFFFLGGVSFFFSFSWCRGLAAICDCGTPWTFLSTFSNTLSRCLVSVY